MDKSKRNRNAGKHPSYKGMTAAQIKRKREYDKKYSATTKRKKYRAKLNKANHDAGTYGNGDKKDISHTKSGRLVKERQSKNRGRNGRNGKSTKK
jgi:hypothetical protein